MCYDPAWQVFGPLCKNAIGMQQCPPPAETQPGQLLHRPSRLFLRPELLQIKFSRVGGGMAKKLSACRLPTLLGLLKPQAGAYPYFRQLFLNKNICRYSVHGFHKLSKIYSTGQVSQTGWKCIQQKVLFMDRTRLKDILRLGEFCSCHRLTHLLYFDFGIHATWRACLLAEPCR